MVVIIKKKKRLRKEVKLFLKILLIILIILIGFFIWQKKRNEKIEYMNTYEYKLEEVGYDKEEQSIIQNNLSNEEIDVILSKEYNYVIPELVQEKYFIFNNLDRYLALYNKQRLEIGKIVSLVNTNCDYDYYENVKEADLTKNEAILVNKYYYLTEDYIPNDLVDVSLAYAYDGNKVTKTVLDAFLKMYDAANKEGIQLIISGSYRSYADQKEMWDNRRAAYGTKNADNYTARAGYSEQQTGLAIIISQFNYSGTDEAPAYKWLEENAYKYGFILRYPEGKEDITGYEYNPRYYRYLGVDLATKVYQENISFEEYYAYYLAN